MASGFGYLVTSKYSLVISLLVIIPYGRYIFSNMAKLRSPGEKNIKN